VRAVAAGILARPKALPVVGLFDDPDAFSVPPRSRALTLVDEAVRDPHREP